MKAPYAPRVVPLSPGLDAADGFNTERAEDEQEAEAGERGC